MNIKVLHIIGSIGKGGKERQLANIMSYSNKNISTGLIVLKATNNDYSDEYNFGEMIKPLINLKHGKKILKPFIFVYILICIVRYIKKNHPYIVWTWGDEETVYAFLASIFCKFKMINGSIRYGVKKKYRYRKFLLKHSSRIVANSKAGAQLYGFPARILYNGIKFSNIPKTVFNNSKIHFISVANLMPYKDYTIILKVLARIKAIGINFSYAILGDGPMRSEIEANIKRYGLIEEVTLYGSVSNVNELLLKADIFLHSSKAEGCSNAIIEAMGAGLPIIATNVGGVPETVSNKNAILYSYRNEDELYDAIIKLITNPDLMTRMGIESYKLARERFSIETMIDNYTKILSDAMNDNWNDSILK